MGVLISSSLFVGKFAIPQTAYTALDALINDTEENYLSELFGADMYADFKSQLTGAPPKPTGTGYLNVYNPLRVDYGSKVYKSKGLITMLLGFTFFDFMRQNMYIPTQVGMTIKTPPDTQQYVEEANLYSYLNDATSTYKAIQYYIQNIHAELFPPNIGNETVVYNGQKKDYGISGL